MDYVKKRRKESIDLKATKKRARCKNKDTHLECTKKNAANKSIWLAKDRKWPVLISVKQIQTITIATYCSPGWK